MKIIAICGPKRAGKDTIADYFVQEQGFTAMKFADPLKRALQTLFSFTDEEVEGSKKDCVHDHWKVKPRTLMQYFGTEVLQFGIQKVLPGIGRTFFAEKLAQTILKGKLERVVVSDMRFPHEAATLAKYFNEQLLVVSVTRRGFGEKTEEDLHPSEVEYKEIAADIVLENNGSIEELKANLRNNTCVQQDR